ncbi:lactate utilization protein B [Lacunimicrobium album]
MIQPTTKHPEQASKFIANEKRAHWHDETLWFVRVKRDRQAASLPEWEQLREQASGIKNHVLTHLPELLEQFEKNAIARGAKVYWAADSAEHNEIILKILKQHNAKNIVKSKSMLTEECHLNGFLERNGYEVVDTDLGERIVQFRKETPSHIVLPAIHIKREEVGETFHEHLGTPAGESDPNFLAEAARGHLREKFCRADIGISGVNFAVAETGGFVVCTNEGNADLGVSLPKVHIACMGMEKLVPRWSDLAVFTRLLARSATGQPITAYTSHFQGPKDDESELHIIIVDNGRTALLDQEDFRNSLKCIRCGACMNTCPVYRRSGGHSYSTTVPGPIGSILAPSRDPKAFYTLPHACTLCGSCTDVCPVKIDLHHQLYTWRSKLVLKNLLPWSKRFPMKVASFAMQRPKLFRLGASIGKTMLRITPKSLSHHPWLNPWGKQRDLPPVPKKTFGELYRERSERVKQG